ncbi:Peptidase S1/S6, partial [Aphelenchoides avenae]
VAKIFHGEKVDVGKYPWAVAIAFQLSSWCGGTLISKRHIVTARHCFKEDNVLERYPTLYLRVFAGGVCRAVGKYCNATDMKELEWDFAAFQAKQTGDIVHQRQQDVAIIQLKEDLAFDDENLQPICLSSPNAPLKHIVNVYGWGYRDDGEPSERLMETQLRLAKDEDVGHFNADAQQCCHGDKMFCMVPRNETLRQDGAKGDSGSGIVAEFTLGKTKTYVLQGFTDAGEVNSDGKHLNIGVNLAKYTYDVCYYTGVCVLPEWVDAKDKSNLTPSDVVGKGT